MEITGLGSGSVWPVLYMIFSALKGVLEIAALILVIIVCAKYLRKNR